MYWTRIAVQMEIAEALGRQNEPVLNSGAAPRENATGSSSAPHSFA
jgi:hypothetical protein